MDRSWMYLAPRSSQTFVNGVHTFLNFAFERACVNGGKIKCPCTKCLNMKYQSRQTVLDHLICSGFRPEYLNWVYHGEGATVASRSTTHNLFSRIPPHVNASASHETGIPIVNTITGHHHHRARTLNRQVNGAFGFPYLSSTTFSGGSERRGRLVAEMHNVLDRIRRGEGLRFEDVMLLNQFVFYGLVDIHDRHRDMRLDIDNMSYEVMKITFFVHFIYNDAIMNRDNINFNIRSGAVAVGRADWKREYWIDQRKHL
ncbi:putative Transposase-associated domain-containing protein [Helianthus annuus]|uniref:RING-type E3 ubiquitin transferase n=1 Tax=Helianthus annuus TaxID=4232 RepID=A0A9K3JGI2_HELAN|nr:putative Transposase-associated domain-containing protein [Helianthus annuus]KAJ0943915.1 putative Transposase-associated domain-containing protein [Helianthus annuus]